MTHHRVDVTGAAIERELPALRDHGTANVLVEERRDDETYTRRETLHLDQRIGADDERYLVRDLIANCPGEQCGLSSRWNLPMKVREYDTRSIKPVIYGTVASILLGGAIFTVSCGIACDEGTTAKSIANYAAIGYGVVLVGALTWIIIECVRGDCHD